MKAVCCFFYVHGITEIFIKLLKESQMLPAEPVNGLPIISHTNSFTNRGCFPLLPFTS